MNWRIRVLQTRALPLGYGTILNLLAGTAHLKTRLKTVEKVLQTVALPLGYGTI